MPTRDTTAGRAYNDLRNLARREGRDPAEYFTLYALEGFLARLALSDYAADFVLKGGVLMAAFAARRPTRDIDLAAAGISNDISEVADRMRSVVTQPRDDGLDFDPDSLDAGLIRDDAAYSGVRVKITAGLVTAQIALHVDVNSGDPIWPAAVEADLPLMLGGTLSLQAYPDHMVLAEKIVTAIDRGDQNTRWRDFVDIAAIIVARRIAYPELRRAIEEVAGYRQVHIEPLAPTLQRMPELAQRRWAVWRRKQRLEATTPEHFEDLLNVCLTFSDPVLDETARSQTWDPDTCSWSDRLKD